MSGNSLLSQDLTRRSFLKAAAACAAVGEALLGRPASVLAQMPAVSPPTREEIIPTICSGCHNDCGMLVHVREGLIRSIEGNPDHPMNQGSLCPKGRSMSELVYSPYRIKRPLLRVGERGEGKWKEISWDEALNTISARLKEIKEKHGPQTLLTTSGAPVYEGIRNAFAQFYSLYGTPNTWGTALCSSPIELVMRADYGFREENDYLSSPLIIVWGANPFASMRPGHNMAYEVSGVCSPLLEAKEKGAKLVVIDPIHTETAAKADIWVPIRPGTDGALALAMLHVIITEGLYDADFVRNWTTGFEELKSHVQPYTPEWASPITDVPAKRIRELAILYGTTRPAIIRTGNTFANHTNGCQAVHALSSLIAITGNLDVPGGSVCFAGGRGDYTILTASPATARPKEPHMLAKQYPLQMTGPAVLDSIFTGKPYTPRALFCYHSNFLLSNVDYQRTREALNKLEFIVVVDIFMTRSIEELADVALPDTSFLERYDYRTHPSARGGVVALGRPVVPPRHESRPWYEIEQDLAKRMGFADKYPWHTAEEFIDYIVKPSKLTFKKLKETPVQYVGKHVWRKYEAGLLRSDRKPGFNTPSGKVELYNSTFKKHGYDPLPTYREPAESPVSTPEIAKDYPLIAVNRRSPLFVHFKYRNLPYLREVEPEPVVCLHPRDAGARAIRDGDWVIITSPRGRIRQKAIVTERVKPGVALIDGGWGNSWDHRDACFNALSDNLKRDPIGQQPSIASFLCQVGKA